MTKRLWPLPLLLLFVSCAGGALRRSDAGRESLTHDGRERTYLVRAPSLAPRDRPLPLVIVLHGGGGNAENAEEMTGFTPVARREGFLVVYPDGSGRTRLRTWNAGHCCGYAMANDVDDVGFISALIDELSGRYPVDPARIFVTGMSNGAMMSHRLGIELSERIAAIAPVVGAVFGDEASPPDTPSALMINGVLDRSVPFAGGPPGGRFSGAWDGTPVRPALEQATFWARAAACAATATRQESPGYVLQVHRCPAGRAVELYALQDDGHAWPGGERGSRRGDAPSSALDATEVIWRFFAAHPR